MFISLLIVRNVIHVKILYIEGRKTLRKNILKTMIRSQLFEILKSTKALKIHMDLKKK